MLTQDEKSELREKFLNILEALPTTPIKRIGQVITIFKVQELSGAMFMDSVKGMSFSTNLVLLYYFCFFFFPSSCFVCNRCTCEYNKYKIGLLVKGFHVGNNY